MSDKELIELLARLLQWALAYGETWYPSQEEVVTVTRELKKRNIQIKI